jgi:S1-C subfamily serine protease
VIGTIIRSEGLILTKASDLGPSLVVRYNGNNYPAVLLSTDEETDLALVGIKETGMPVVRWSDELPAAGAVVASPILLQESTDEMVAEATSYVGVFSHILKKGLPSVHATSQVTSLGVTTEQLESGLRIAAIKPETPAFESGLSPGDLIKKLNDRPIQTRIELTAFLDRCEVGEKVTAEIERGGASKTLELELVSPLIIPPATGFEISGGISMVPSIRRAPFPDVIVHTIPINAWDCGSPIFDLNGRALGLNIAAISPARTVALTPRDIRAAIDRMLAKTLPF